MSTLSKILERNEQFDFEGNNITFKVGEVIMVNATEMAKPFGKSAKHWLSNQSTVDYLSELSKVRNLTFADLVTVTKGSPENGGGTWMHEDAALEFARWLSPSFAIWCNDRIKELLTVGMTTVSNDDEVILNAMRILQKRLEENSKQLKIAQTAIVEKEEQIEELTPKAKYTDEVLMSETTYTMTQVAKEFGMGASSFSDFLFKKKIIFRQSGMWMMFAKYDNEGYSAVRTKKIENGNGSVITSSYLVWTEKGRMFLHNKFDRELNVDPQLNIFD